MFPCTAEEQKSRADSTDGIAASPDPKSPRLPPFRTGRAIEAAVKFHVVSDADVDDPMRQCPRFGDECHEP